MANSDCVPTHEDFFDKQPQDLLSFGDIQGIGTCSQAAAKISECLNQPQILGLIGCGRFQRLQFRLNGLVLAAEFGHAAAQLFQTHQSILIGCQQPIHALRQPAMIPVQLLLPPLQRIGIPGRLQPAVELLLNDFGILQQPHDLAPDHGIQLVLANGRIFADRTLEMTIGVRTDASVVIEPACRGLC